MKPQDPESADFSRDVARQREALSALADGQADGEQAALAFRAWREDPQARQHWHAVQLIGDVLRSDELARPAAADAAFLSRLRERLADEPVVLAPAAAMARPEPAASARARRAAPRWLLPSAVAAGFVAVAGVLVVARMSGPAAADAAGVQARASAPATALGTGQGLSAPAVAQAQGPATMIRSAELDAYLRAHQSARGGGAVAVPGGMLRSAEVLLPEEGPPR